MAQPLSKPERKRQLLDAAIKIFGGKGYHQTQISNIIDEAGVARGTFYLYFKGKREIFDELISELFATVQDQVKTLPRDAFDKIPTQLKENLERVTSLMLDQPWLIKILFNEAMGLDAELDARLRTFYERLLDLIERALKQGNEMGFVRAGNYTVLAIGLLGSVKEVFYQHCLGTQKLDREQIVEELFRLVVHAVAAPGIDLGQILV